MRILVLPLIKSIPAQSSLPAEPQYHTSGTEPMASQSLAGCQMSTKQINCTVKLQICTHCKISRSKQSDNAQSPS